MSRAVRSRTAFSNITSTVILSSVLLAIMITASYLANDVLSIQMAATEFKSAEELVTTLDNEISKLMFRPGSSTVIKTSFSTTAPGYTQTGRTMNATFTGSPTRAFSMPLNYLNVEGRQIIGGAFEYDVQGDASLLIPPYNGSFGRIHISKPSNWRVSLDYERVLYTYTGLVNLFDGTAFVPMNTLEVTSIVLEFGEFNVTESNIIVISNEHIVTETISRTGNFGLTITSPNGGRTIYLDDMGGNPSYPTQVNFHEVHIQISVLEG